MASPTTERSLSATSHENTPEEKEVEMAAEKSAEKVAEKVAEKTETLEKGNLIAINLLDHKIKGQGKE